MPKKKTPATSVPAENPQPPADATALPPSTQTVLAQLDTENGMTAAEVVESSGLGRSTVTKALSTLREAGLAVRQDGGHEGTRRIADRWFAAPGAMEAVAADHTPDPSREADDDGGHVTAAEPSRGGAQDQETEPESRQEHAGDEAADDGPDEQTTDGAPDDSEATALAAAPDETDPAEPERGPETGQAAASDDVSETTEHDGEPAESAAAPGPGPDPGTGEEEAAPVGAAEPGPARLGKGELRAQVADHLRDHPGRAWTPSAIAKVLGRSAGAINNACEKLLETEAVTTFDDKPRRFQWRSDQDASAA